MKGNARSENFQKKNESFELKENGDDEYEEPSVSRRERSAHQF